MFLDFMTKSEYAQRKASGKPPRFDFITGNPYEMPMPEFVAALTKAIQPEAPSWFRYQHNEKPACDLVAKSLTGRLGLAFDPADILMTSGSFSGLTVALSLVADPGDEVIISTPWWSMYPTIFEAASVVPVKAPLAPSFGLDLDAIRRAITPRTRAMLLTSPHNPSGHIWRADELAGLSELLKEASRVAERPIFLLSDEAFSRIIYDGHKYESPVGAYPHSILIYTYGKTLLTPGERIGFLAMPTLMPEADRRALRGPLFHLAAGNGWCFPSASLARALPEIDPLVVDIEHLQGNRDLLCEELKNAGYEINRPEATFFMLLRSPIPDDFEFARILAENDIFVLPGSMLLAPGYLRISLCATRDTVRDSIVGFKNALRQVKEAR